MEVAPFATLSQIRILLVPVGSISKASFDKWATLMRSFDTITLSDIPPNPGDDKSRFMPSQLSNGHLHLAFTSHPPPAWHSAFSVFRISSFPLGVVGIAECNHISSLGDIISDFDNQLEELFPNNSVFPLARNCFAFEDGQEHANVKLEDHPGLRVIPSEMSNPRLYISTLVAELCSNILGEFATLAHILETPFGIDSLNIGILPTFPVSNDEGGAFTSPRDSIDGLSVPSSPTTAGTLRQPVPNRQSMSRTPSGSSGANGRPSPTPSANKRISSISNSIKRQRINQPNARLAKVYGDLFLLAGRINDAVLWYNEALTLFRSPFDSIWHASVLEGLCTTAILDSWAGHGSQASAAQNGLRDPWADVAEKLSIAMGMYLKATPYHDRSSEYTALTLLYVDSVMRYTNLLFSIWSNKGWGVPAFETMLRGGVPPTFKPSPPTEAQLWRMTTITTITRTQIANVIAQAHGPWLLHLHAHDRIRVLSGIAATYSCLGFKRKEVYVLQEVLAVIMDLIVCARDEGREALTAGLGIATPGGAPPAVGVREHVVTEGNESVLRMVKYVCEVYGVDLTSVKVVGGKKDGAEAEQGSQVNSSADEDLDASSTPLFGWPDLQVDVVKAAVAVAEALPDYPTVAQFALSTLKALHPYLNSREQLRLYDTSTDALRTARRRGDEGRMQYWSSKPVTSVEVSPLPFSGIPVEHPMKDLAPKDGLVGPVIGKAKDPFIYNPRLKLLAATQALVVQNEPLEFVVTLQNPFLFNFELPSLSLSTSGVPFQSTPIAVTIPANAYHAVRLKGVALEPGTLVIRGCIVQTVGGEPREFVLPMSTDEEESKRDSLRSASLAEMGRMKYSGLEARPSERARKRLSAMPPSAAGTAGNVTEKPRPVQKFLECKVVPEQPLLRIRRTSLTHGAVMLYDGESSKIRLTVENISSLPVDFLKLTFDDSTIAPAQQALADGDLSVAEAYETEYDLVHRPVFSWDAANEPHEIGPGRRAVVTVTCLGKVGCTDGTMQLSYSFAHRQLPEGAAAVFHTRQILYPVLVTVYHTLECQAMDVLPFLGIDAQDDEAEDDEARQRRSLLNVSDDGQWCLFVVDVNNSYGLPFEIHFERQQEGTPVASTTRLVPPGSTSRILLPLKRTLLPAEHTSQIIPTLSDRQFVVSKSKISPAELKAQRELFWYREELFKCVRSSWQEPGGTRYGELSLRKQRLTMSMLNAFRTDRVQLDLTLVKYTDGDSKGQTFPIKTRKTYAPPNEFIYLRAHIRNVSPSPLPLVLHISATPPDHLHYEGYLNGIPVGKLQPQEDTSVEIPLCFMAEGRFELAAEVRALGDDTRAGEAELRVIVTDMFAP